MQCYFSEANMPEGSAHGLLLTPRTAPACRAGRGAAALRRGGPASARLGFSLRAVVIPPFPFCHPEPALSSRCSLHELNVWQLRASGRAEERVPGCCGCWASRIICCRRPGVCSADAAPIQLLWPKKLRSSGCAVSFCRVFRY